MSATDIPTLRLSWRDWRGRARWSVSDGRETVGAIFESRGVFTSVTSSGFLVGAFPTLKDAAASLPSAHADGGGR